MSESGHRGTGWSQRAALLCALTLATLLAGVGAARAAVGIESFEFSLSATQAAAHPDLETSFAFVDPSGPETVRDVRIGAPRGFFLYPDAVPSCAAEDFGEFECPPGAQVGLATVRAGHLGDPDFLLGTAPLYRVTPGHGQFMRFGFVLPTLEVPVLLPASVRADDDYGIDLRIADFPQLSPLAGAELEVWAVPADPSHDGERFPQGTQADPAGCPGIEGTACLAGETPVAIPARPLTRNPTSCADPLGASLEVNSWQAPADTTTADDAAISPTGCAALAFSPQLSAALSSTAAASPTGLELGLRSTGETTPGGISWSDLKAASVALPEGMAIDATLAATHPICTLEQAHLDLEGPDECPAESRVGSFTAGVLGAEAPASGSAYFGGAEAPGSHRLILIAIGGGIDLRRVALVEPDPGTGLETVSLTALPQFPFEDLDVELDEETGLLLAPEECGDYEARAELTPWSAPDAPVTLADEVTIDSDCPAPAAEVEVSLEPASIEADGESVSIATAAVTDADGQPLTGEEVFFESTDPEQLIGHVEDNGDGTYTTEITASTTPGVATIAAVDESADPAISGTATLTQTAIEQPPVDKPPVVVPPPPPLDPAPVVTLTRRPPRRGHDLTPTFRFTASEPASFRCRLDLGATRRCTSPLTLPPLVGRHVFRIQATDSSGQRSEMVVWRFAAWRR